MLTLTRKESQRIFIGNDIVVTLVQSSDGCARIGVDAPKDVPIYREEIMPAKLPPVVYKMGEPVG